MLIQGSIWIGVFYVDSVANIVRYMYTKCYKILDFLQALTPMIFTKHCKKQSGEIFWAPYREYLCPELM
jgi:hypothetical protein